VNSCWQDTSSASQKHPPDEFSRQTSVVLAEVAFLLIMIAGVWLVFAEKLHSEWRFIVVGILLAVAGLLLIVATRLGQLFGKPGDAAPH
jgi:hypothetical protein